MAGTIGRRTFVKASLAAGISIVVRPLAAIGQTAVPGVDAAGYAWQRTPTTAARRIDGWQKVTGAKVYAADFRAADMPGWPRDTAHAMLIKTPDATRVFEGIDLAMLDKELAPDRVVLAPDLAAAAITVPPFYAGDLLCPAGKTPLYLGQPLALLIWNDFARFALARQAIKASSGVIRFGAKTSPVAAPPYASARFVRVAGPTPKSDDVYSPMQAGWDFPILYQKDDRADLGGAFGQRLRCAARVLLRRSDSQRDQSEQPRSICSRPDVPDAVDRSGLPGAGGGPCLVRQRQAQARARARRPVAVRGRRQRRQARCEECVRAGGQRNRDALRRGGRRLRRQGPHHLSALRGAGRIVFAGPSGAPRQRPLRSVPVRPQASCADRAQPHGGGPCQRPHHRVRVGPESRRRRPRQSLRRRRVRRRGRFDWDL